jgi:hypothetical protein
MRQTLLTWAVSLATLLAVQTVEAGDWPQFRGPNGDGVSTETKVPVEWSDTKNLRWKTEIPGPGSSSPIVSGDRVYITCYTGYGVGRGEVGQQKDLQRHLVALNRNTGKIVWSKAVAAALPEDQYRGFIAEHGYATSTPVTDGERVYVFFGKSGVLAFDRDGKQLWQTGVGTESGQRRWGSGTSPILHGDYVIVNAAEESQSLRALDKKTGKEVWKAEAAGLENTWGSPSVITLPDGRKELVISVPYEMWGFNPQTGKLSWFAETNLDSPVSPSIVSAKGIVYAIGGRRGGSVAVRAGGKDDVTKSNIVWKGDASAYVPSPVLTKGKLYWVDDRGLAMCVDAKTGKLVKRVRLESGNGGFGGRPFYASVVVAGDKWYAVSRTAGVFVLKANAELETIGSNRFASDESDFNASPAISDGAIFLRSNRFVYCIAEK